MRLVKKYYSEVRDKNNKILLYLSINIVEEQLEIIADEFIFLQSYIEIGAPIIYIEQHKDLHASFKNFSNKITELSFLSKDKEYDFNETIDQLFETTFNILNNECLQKKLTIPDFLLLENGDFNQDYFNFLNGNNGQNQWSELIRSIESGTFVSEQENEWLYFIYINYYKGLVEEMILEEVHFNELIEQFKNDSFIINCIIDVYNQKLTILESKENKCYIIIEANNPKPIAFVNI